MTDDRAKTLFRRAPSLASVIAEKKAEAQHQQPPASPPHVSPEPDVGNVGQRKEPVKLTKEQIRAVTEEVAELLTFPSGEMAARKQMRAKYGLTSYQVNRLIKAIYRSWKSTDERNLGNVKAQAIRRLEAHLRKAMEAPKPSWMAIATLEAQLAKIQGTEAPVETKVQVNVDMGPALAGVLAGLTVERMEELAAEYDAKVLPPHRTETASSEVIEGELVEPKV